MSPIRSLRRAAAVLALASASLAPATLHAQSGFYVTLVARECPTFASIMANRARNNIQESLQDLGPDSVYGTGDDVEPGIEDAGNACTPMQVPWTFTLGRTIAGADVDVWGSLSYVGGVFRSTTTTLAGVPQRNTAGAIVSGTIASAVTIELTADEAAQTTSQLWVQGGVPGQPLNALQSTYGFGALRCGVDILNGDNVEYVSYPTGFKHQYCYAYYVKPPPTSGTIVVVKNNTGIASTDFVFRGNLSYTPDPDDPADPASNYFVLAPPGGGSASQSFYRAGGSTWNVREALPPGWQLTGASCASAGSNPVTTNGPGDFSIPLVAGDTVTCTFSNAPLPPTAGLQLLKISGDGDPDNGIVATGTFDLAITGPSVSLTGTATTIAEGVPAPGIDAPALAAGTTYTLSETWPANDPRGTWALDPTIGAACRTCPGEGACTDVPVTPVATATGASFQLTMPATPTVCAFNNRLVYSASLQIGKLPRGGGGTFGYQVTRLDTPEFTYHRVVDAPVPNAVAFLPPDEELPFGSYRIQEVEANPGNWAFVAVACYDTEPPQDPGLEGPPLLRLPPSGNAFVDVTLSAQRPFLRCVFENRLVPPPRPPTAVPANDRIALALASLLLLLLARRRLASRRPQRCRAR